MVIDHVLAKTSKHIFRHRVALRMHLRSIEALGTSRN